MSDEKKKRVQPPETLTIELSKPVALGSGADDQVYTEIALREPNVEQLMAFVKRAGKEGGLEAMRWLVSSLSGVPITVLSKIGVRDFYKAQSYLSLFIEPPDEDDPEGNEGGSQETGSAPYA